ncbi:MAG: hypothetical protein QMC83_10375, partial [Thermodesulfovibrionales bacterium]|nr:hypothetical protein [Thermodesulfovibrionales bacterium]
KIWDVSLIRGGEGLPLQLYVTPDALCVNSFLIFCFISIASERINAISSAYLFSIASLNMGILDMIAEQTIECKNKIGEGLLHLERL